MYIVAHPRSHAQLTGCPSRAETPVHMHLTPFSPSGWNPSRQRAP